MKIKRDTAVRKVRNVSYLRVSTDGQDCEKNKSDILKFANDRDFGQVTFVEEKMSGMVSWKKRKIKQVIDELESGDRLIIPELSRLGRSTLEIMEMLSISKSKGISIYDVKNNWELNGSLQSEVLAFAFSIAARIERDLISARTKEGLRHASARGVILGRRKGPGKSLFDAHRIEILDLLQSGKSKTFVAARFGTSPPNLLNWLRKNEIDVKPR
jgi:DNA invertase Pin-like site-specific DNA recombinase